MAEYTTNLNLKKPTYAEQADIKDINDNMDTLDTAVKANQDAITALQTGKINTPSGVAEGQFLQTDENGDPVWGDPADQATIISTTEGWLANHINTNEFGVDDTLLISGDAADSKVTGDKLKELKSAFENGAVRYDIDQSISTQNKNRARINIGAANHDNLLTEVSTRANEVNELRNRKISLPSASNYGNAGQILRSTGTGTEWADPQLPDYEDIETAINEWLDNHPESTTTVQDHSLSFAKMINGTFGFVIPEMFGAVGNGIADDSAAVQNAIDSGYSVYFSKTYYITEPLSIRNITNRDFCGNGTLLFNYEICEELVKYFHVLNCKNIRISGIELKSTYGESTELLDLTDLFKNPYYGIFINDSENIVINNCKIKMFNDGMHVNDSTGIIVKNCYFENNAQEHAVFENCSYCQFIYNNCKWNSGDGVIVKHYSLVEGCHFLFEGNNLHDGKETRIELIDHSFVWNIGGGFTCNCEGQSSVYNNSEGIIAANNHFINVAYGVLLANANHAIVHHNICRPKKSINTGNYTVGAVMGVDSSVVNNPTTIHYCDIKFTDNIILGGRRGIRADYVQDVATITADNDSIVIDSNYIEDVELESIRSYMPCTVTNNVIKNGYNVELTDCNASGNSFELSRPVRLIGDCIFTRNKIYTEYHTAIETTGANSLYIKETSINGITSKSDKIQQDISKIIADFVQGNVIVQNIIYEYTIDRTCTVTINGTVSLESGWNVIGNVTRTPLAIQPITGTLAAGEQRDKIVFGFVAQNGDIQIYNPNTAMSGLLIGSLNYYF